ncbi:MAG TPA: hypothetical protein VN721_07215 [Flavipsychrobacter sp.]|nr:hypothetical protein [Flavipsychrobacter sp.]
MKSRILKNGVFIGKSLLWSLLLYVICMAIINKDEIAAIFRNKNDIQTAQAQMPSGGSTTNALTNIPVPKVNSINKNSLSLSAVKNIFTVISKVTSVLAK